MFSTAGLRAEALFTAGGELVAALLARLGLLAPVEDMHVADATRPATSGAARCDLAAINAVPGVFGGAGELSTMNRFMARYAERDAVRHVKGQFRSARNRLDVVGVNRARRAAVLAGEVVSLINGLAPQSEIVAQARPFDVRRLAALPCSSERANERLAGAGSGTEARPFVSTVEGLTAVGALPGLRRVTVRPTILGAVVSGSGTISLDHERSAADDTGGRNLGVLHGRHCITKMRSTQISPAYCAVALQRLADMGLEPKLIDDGRQ